MFEDKLTLFHLFGFLPVSATSIVDILIVAFIIYRVLGLIRGTRAAQMLAGLFLVITVAMAAPLFEMDALVWLLEQVRSILLILLVILFQPELRRFLGVLGQSPVFRWLYKTESSHLVDEVATAAEQMASRGFGALLVMVRDVQLGSIVDSGVPLKRSGLRRSSHHHFHPQIASARSGGSHSWGAAGSRSLHPPSGRGCRRPEIGHPTPGGPRLIPGIGRRDPHCF